MQYHALKPERILETVRRLQKRIAERFPGSGLSDVAGELVGLADRAGIRAERIGRPNFLLRAAVVVLLAGALALGVRLGLSFEFRADLRDAKNLFEFVELAVRPDSQRRGIGGGLHDALLAGLPHHRALLSTWREERPARRLYLKRGWQVLQEELDASSSLLGKDLRD